MKEEGQGAKKEAGKGENKDKEEKKGNKIGFITNAKGRTKDHPFERLFPLKFFSVFLLILFIWGQGVQRKKNIQ